MRRDIIQAVQDQGGELATGLSGKNFFDVSEETHPLYHPGEGGKVDYKNLLAKTQELPDTATLEERLAELNRSRAISTAASEAADISPQAVKRQTDLIETIKLGGGEEVLDVYGNPFDRSIRTTEGIAALRKPLKAGLSMKGGAARFLSVPFIGGVVAGTATLASGGSPAQAFGAVVEAENPIENLDAGPIFNEREDFGTVLKQAKEQNQIPLKTRIQNGAFRLFFPKPSRGRYGAKLDQEAL